MVNNKRISIKRLNEVVEIIMNESFVTIEDYELKDVMIELRQNFNVKSLKVEINDFDELIVSLV